MSEMKLRRSRNPMVWFVFGTTLNLLFACNPGQCLRQSDCPLGSACTKGVCKLAPKPASSQKDAGSRTTATLVQSTAGQDTTFPDASNDAAAGSDVLTISEQSSNLDSISDTATTLSR